MVLRVNAVGNTNRYAQIHGIELSVRVWMTMKSKTALPK
jgi:hypothetical protein